MPDEHLSEARAGWNCFEGFGILFGCLIFPSVGEFARNEKVKKTCYSFTPVQE